VIRVVTIEREYGSGAPSISHAIAEELGWKLWDREITAEVARRMKCSHASVERVEERPDPMFQRLSRIFMRGSFEATAGEAQPDVLNAESLVTLYGRIVTDLVAQGNCVIVGRGSPWLLRDRDDVFRVFLYAGRDEKIRRTMASGQSRADAERLVDTVDPERAAFVRQYFNSDWPSRHLYHLMVNTEMGDAIAVKTILDGMEMLDIVATGRRRTA